MPKGVRASQLRRRRVEGSTGKRGMRVGRGLKLSRFEKENRSIVIMGRIKVIRN